MKERKGKANSECQKKSMKTKQLAIVKKKQGCFKTTVEAW